MGTITTALLTRNRNVEQSIGSTISPGGFIIRPWISDIQTGLSPGMTITGGPTYVKDYLGTLRRTPAGYAAIEGGRYVTTVADGAVLGPELLANTAPNFRVLRNGIDPITSYSASVALTVNRLYAINYTISDNVGTASAGFYIGSTAVPTGQVNGGFNGSKAFNSTYLSGNPVISLSPSTTIVDFIVRAASVREIIPQWLPAPAEPSILVPTRKGLRTVYNAATYKGPLIEPASTNKCTCVKANPTATTNIIKSGDAAAVLSVVNDAAALAAAGLDGVCMSGMVYKLDNSAGALAAYANISGDTGNVNPHSVFAFIRGGAGALTQNNAAVLSTFPVTAEFTLIKFDNFTPYATTAKFAIRANAGAIVYFILPQLEELPYCTSPIIGTDTAAAQTRAAVVTSAPTAGVFPASGQDFAIFLDTWSEAAGINATLFSTYVDADNLFKITSTATGWIEAILRKTAANNTASVSYTHTAAERFQTLAIKTAMGIAIKVRKYSSGAWQAWAAWKVVETAGAKASSPIGTTYQIGALNSINQFPANYPITSIIQMPPKATLAEYQTWIEGELTRRGLI